MPTRLIPSAQVDHFVHDHLPPPEQWPELRFDRPELQLPAQVNAVQALFERAAAAGHADRPLFRSDERTLSYAQAQVEVNRIANALTVELGLVPGNRVLLRGGNSVAMALAWLATVQAGLIAVATMPLLRAKELGAILQKAQPVLALCDVKLQDELKVALAANPATAGMTMLVFNTGGAEVPHSLEAMAQRQCVHSAPCPTAATDIALLAFTSGTTGTPKAAVHTHRDVLAACETWPRHVLRATPEDIVMGSPPLAFTFGLGGLLVYPMWAGASVYFPSVPYTPEGMVQLMIRVGATICYTAPTFYRQMAAFAKVHGIGKLRISVSAGEGLPDATRQLWKEATGLEMLDGIGATEMFHIFISSPPESVRRGAIGQVVPGYQAQVVNDAGEPLPIGEVGKLAVIGPTGCRYLDDERQTNYVKGGWNLPGRRLSHGRRRLLFLPGAHRRHDHHRRLQRGRPGGGSRAAGAPGGGRVRRGGQTRRRARPDRAGLRGAQAGPRRGCRADEGAARPCQAQPGSLQIPARGGLHDPAATHRNRQAAALCIAPASHPTKLRATR